METPRTTGTRTGLRGVIAGVAIAMALLAQAGVAHAASRGFQITNSSARDLQLVGATPLPKQICGGYDETNFGCVSAAYDMDFEGRPADGSTLGKGQSQTWELKYWYNAADLFGVGYNYAAKLTYRVAGGNGQVVVVIQTSNYANDSSCTVVNSKSLRSCSAQGRQITVQ